LIQSWLAMTSMVTFSLAAVGEAPATAGEVEVAPVEVATGAVVAVLLEHPAKARTANRLRARFIYSISQFGQVS
jgi:hypothetical protein